MKIIDIDELREGDILSEPIHNAHGHVLLPANAVISINSLKLLKFLNISKVTIKNVENEDHHEGLTDEEIDDSLSYLLDKISWKPQNDYELELLKMAAIHRLKGDDLR